MTPRYRILDSAVRAVSVVGANRWQLHLVKLPSWNYSFLWMRPLDVDSDAGFIVLDERFGRERIFGGTETLQTLGAPIDEIIGDDLLARRFVLNTRGELRQGNQRAHETLLVTRDGIARWGNRHASESAPFRWRASDSRLTGARFVALSAAQVWSELQTLLADAQSEAAFARGFAQMNSQERIQRVQRPARGNLDELNRLLHQLLLASAPWEIAGDNELFLGLNQRDNALLWKVSQSNPVEIEVPAAMRNGVRKLWDYFEPFAPTVADYLCVQSTDTPSLFARAFRPSAHQQLEAQLRFRDWEQNV